MTRRTGEQPQFDDDTQQTEVLSASSARARHGTTVDSPEGGSTQPTRIITQHFYTADDQATRVLGTAGYGSYDPQPTEVIPGTNTAAQSASAPPRPLPRRQYRGQPATPEPGSPYGGEHTRNLRLATMRRTRPTTWAMIQHFMALTATATLLIFLLWFFLLTPLGQQLDENSFTEFSYQFINLQSQTSNLLNLIPAAAGVLAAIGFLFILLWKHRIVPAIIGITVAVAANASTQLLKNYLITKPDYGIQEALLNSAPSGHTTFAASAAAALFLASPKKLRPSVALLGSLFTLAAGFSTIINGWHRPVDVVSAVAVTQIWTIMGLGLLRFMRSEELDMSNTRNSGLILVPLLTIAGFFLGFCSLALYAVTIYDPISGGALMAAACMIFAVTAFATSTQIALLRPQNKIRSAYTKVWTY